MDYARNAKYFSGKKGIFKPVIMLIVGLLIMTATIFGLVIALAGGAWLYLTISYNKSVPTDSEIDGIARGYLSDIQAKAVARLGIDEDALKEADPIMIHGQAWQQISKPYVWKQGEDGVNRPSNYNGIIFLFSSDQIFAYRIVFSLIEKEERVSTEEYFYGDVVSVASSTESTNAAETGGQVINFENFVLTTSGGTRMSAGYRAGLEEHDRSITAMKNIVRAKKQELANK